MYFIGVFSGIIFYFVQYKILLELPYFKTLNHVSYTLLVKLVRKFTIKMLDPAYILKAVHIRNLKILTFLD